MFLNEKLKLNQKRINLELFTLEKSVWNALNKWVDTSKTLTNPP